METCLPDSPPAALALAARKWRTYVGLTCALDMLESPVSVLAGEREADMKKLAVVLALTVAVLGCQVAGPQIPTQGTLTAFNQTASTTITSVVLKDATNATVWSLSNMAAGTSASISLDPGQYTLTITDATQTASGTILIAAGVNTNWNFFGP